MNENQPYSPSKQLLNRLSNPSTPNKKYNNSETIIPNEELSKYGIIDDYCNEIQNENYSENNENNSESESDNNSNKDNEDNENNNDELYTENESSTTNSTDIIMAEIMSRKPKNIKSKIPKPSKSHLAPENLYYRSVNKPKITKKENKNYTFKPNKIPYSSLDHRFENIMEAQDMMRKDRITKRKKELEDSIKPFHGLEEREIIKQLNKSMSIKYREDEIKKQHKQYFFTFFFILYSNK